MNFSSFKFFICCSAATINRFESKLGYFECLFTQDFIKIWIITIIVWHAHSYLSSLLIFGITVFKYSSNFFGIGTCLEFIKSLIFLYLSNMSNFMFDCNFRRHTGHSYKGFFADSLSWFDPFMRQSKNMQCLTPNICVV